MSPSNLTDTVMNPDLVKDYSRHHHQTGSSSATSALRPRGRKPVSGSDSPPVDTFENRFLVRNAGPFDLLFQSDVPSPIPSRHPSRASSQKSTQRHKRLNSGEHGQKNGTTTQVHGNDLAASLSGFWGKSWTSLQGLASNVLSNDVTQDSIKDKPPQRRRRPLEATHSRQWGPGDINTNRPVSGGKEDITAQVRARKRYDLLTVNGLGCPDSSLRYKRRTSDEFESTSAAPSEYDRDVPVYVHHVKPEDTLAGISIKFNCQLATVKKANALWSNDIQAKKFIFLPVAACGVRGKPVSPSGGVVEDLVFGELAQDSEAPLISTPSENPWLDPERRSSSTIRLPASTSTPNNLQISPSPSTTKSSEEPLWKHDSWVRLEGHPAAVEIARLPRRELGFFPRARRRSSCYSDLDTPSASFDLPRPSINVSERTSSSSKSVHDHRSRRSSSSHKFAHHLVGPGGVGSLVGNGPSIPGPAPDNLSKALAKHLPNVAPPRQRLLDDEDGETIGMPHENAMNLDNVGGAIESWVRKLAKSAVKAIESKPATPALQPRRNNGLGSGLGSGDLIELSDAFELDEDTGSLGDSATDQIGRGRPLHSSSGALGDTGRVLRGRLPSPSQFEDLGSKKKGD